MTKKNLRTMKVCSKIQGADFQGDYKMNRVGQQGCQEQVFDVT